MGSDHQYQVVEDLKVWPPAVHVLSVGTTLMLSNEADAQVCYNSCCDCGCRDIDSHAFISLSQSNGYIINKSIIF